MRKNFQFRSEKTYQRERNALRMLPVNESLLGEQMVAQRNAVYQINSAFGLSELRQNTTATGSGTGTLVGGKIRLSTGTTPSSSYKVESAEVGQYAPGFAAEMGLGLRPHRTPTGNEFIEWGGISASNNDGFFFRQTAADIFAVRLKGGAEAEAVAKSDWNFDRLDGSKGDFNPSGLTLDATDGYIWQVDFTWYGYGIIVFGLIRSVASFREAQYFVPVHVMSVDGDVSVDEPNMQIFAKVDNGGDATDLVADLGGMQYSIVGSTEGQRNRQVTDYRRSVSLTVPGTRVHLISFRRKSGFLNRAVFAKSFLVTAASNDILVEIFVNGTVNGGSWGNPQGHTASETSLESNLSASSYTPGIKVFTGIAFAGQANKPGQAVSPEIDAVLPAGSTFTITGTPLGGSATAGTVLFTMTDGW